MFVIYFVLFQTKVAMKTQSPERKAQEIAVSNSLGEETADAERSQAAVGFL